MLEDGNLILFIQLLEDYGFSDDEIEDYLILFKEYDESYNQDWRKS